MFNKEIKGNLARLLATENLVVEHKKVPTASFDVVRRVLTLPLWEKASSTVYDLLVGHEVGHALYTPSDDWDDTIPKDFLNVVEDARIEKLMKRKYPGLARDFHQGYQELNDDDFFGISDEDLTKFNLIDRINLHFKIGSYACIPFHREEKHFVDMISEAETFEDVLSICKKLVSFLDERKEQTSKIDLDIDIKSNGSGSCDKSQDQSQNLSFEETDEDGDKNPADSDQNKKPESFGQQESADDGSFGHQGSGPSEEEVSKTQRSFDSSTETLTDSSPMFRDTVYVEIPKIHLDRVVVTHDELMPYISKYFDDLYKERKDHWGDIYETVDANYFDYKKQAQKEVNYLVKEFECKKSADAYSRSTVSKTGVLDTKSLHTYKYNDDLFKKVSVIPDGKNHGMIFILDWSGSMSNVLLDTYKQLLNLLWFCKKVQIPFEVYAFSYEWNNNLIDKQNNGCSYERGNHKLALHKRFSLLNIMTSRCNNKVFEESARNMWRIASYFTSNGYVGSYSPPAGLDLSGTPLNESIVALHSIIPQFKKMTKVQKINVCILTDGESNGISYDLDLTDVRGFPYMVTSYVNEFTQLRDRKLGRVYRKSSGAIGDDITRILLENLKDNFPEVNLIGFRIATGSDFSYMYRVINNLRSYEIEETMKTWRKQKCWEFNNIGYDSWYVISGTSLSANTEFEVSEDASKNEISKAFRSMLKAKTTNKKILNSFASLVA
jgi:hypothetical protein